jgi:hypothetical protein
MTSSKSIFEPKGETDGSRISHIQTTGANGLLNEITHGIPVVKFIAYIKNKLKRNGSEIESFFMNYRLAK